MMLGVCLTITYKKSLRLDTSVIVSCGNLAMCPAAHWVTNAQEQAKLAAAGQCGPGHALGPSFSEANAHGYS